MLKDGYKFVYSLLDANGYVFYIGCTKNVFKRYKEHLMGTAKTKEVIAEMVQKGKFPNLIIISYLPAREANKKEGQMIGNMSETGHKLVNTVFCGNAKFWGNKFPPSECTIKENALIAAQYQQDKFLHFFAHLEEYGHYITNCYSPIPNFK